MIHPEALKRLSYREREIIKLRYGIGNGYSYTLEEVGRIFKCTRERARQIEKKALDKLSVFQRGLAPETEAAPAVSLNEEAAK